MQTLTVAQENLKPRPGVSFLIATAVEVERNAVLRVMRPPDGHDRVVKVPYAESTYFLGTIGRYVCALVLGEAGSDTRRGSALEIQAGIERWNPLAVLAPGIAFGRRLDANGREVQVAGDVLVSTQLYPYHHAKVTPDGDEDRGPHPEASIVLLDRVKNSFWTWTDAGQARKPILGPLLTGPYVINDAKNRDSLFSRFPLAIGGEMEATGIYSACSRSGRQWLVIKAVCDWGAGKNDEHQRRAAENAVALMHALLSEEGLDAHAFGQGSRAQGTRSFEADVAKLRNASERTLLEMADEASLTIGGTRVQVSRQQLPDLVAALDGGSCVVVGPPGVGKSGLLHALALMLQGEGRDVVVLAAEDMRDDFAPLRLDHDLVEVLHSWPGSGAGCLLVDALDSLRDRPAAAHLRRWMPRLRKTAPRWRVVASVRSFEFHNSLDLPMLFGEATQPGLARPLRSVSVSGLSDDEFSELQAKAPAVASLVSSASPALLDLLRIPFNLRLACDLLMEGDSGLRSVASRGELLDRFWRCRVRGDSGESAAPEAALRTLCEKMVDSGRLSIDWGTAIAASDERDLTVLLRSGVLRRTDISPKGEELRFSHHILFDYAIERLLLRGGPRVAADWLGGRRARSLVVRPSIVSLFEGLWDVHRDAFWCLLYEIAKTNGIPESGKLIGPGVASRRAGSPVDLQPLLDEVRRAPASARGSIGEALTYLIGGWLTTRHATSPSILPVQCAFAASVANLDDSSLAGRLKPLVWQLAHQVGDLSQAACQALNAAGRWLLGTAWSSMVEDEGALHAGLIATCRTYATAADESRALLRHALERGQLCGARELQVLSDEMTHLTAADPALVADLYEAAFSREETSDEATRLDGGVIGLTSTRRQDFQLGRSKLVHAFAGFIRSQPRLAARVVARMTVHARRGQRTAISSVSFELRGRRITMISEAGWLWEFGAGEDSGIPGLLHAFGAHLREMTSTKHLDVLLEGLGADPLPAAVVRAILMAGATNQTLCRELRELAWTPAVLEDSDTAANAAAFLSRALPLLGAEDRARVERAILSLRSAAAAYELRRAFHPAEPVPAEIRAAVDRLPPAHSGGRSGSDSTFVPDVDDTREDPLTQIPHEIAGNVDSLRSFALGPRDGSEPQGAALSSLLERLRLVLSAISSGAVANEAARSASLAWAAEAATRLVWSANDGVREASAPLAEVILLRASEQSPSPRNRRTLPRLALGKESDARVAAVDGLLGLAWNGEHVSPPVLAAIERLAADSDVLVRQRAAGRLAGLLRFNTALFWRLVERICTEESDVLVAEMLARDVLQRIWNVDPRRTAEVAWRLLGRAWRVEHDDDLRRSLGGVLALLMAWRGEPAAVRGAVTMTENPAAWVSSTHGALFAIRQSGALTFEGSATWRGDAPSAIRGRALRFMTNVAVEAARARSDVERANSGSPPARWPLADAERWKQMTRLLVDVGSALFFSSGAFDRHRDAGDEGVRVSKEGQGRFLADVAPIIEVLAAVALPKLAHDLVEMLRFLWPHDPARAFLLLANVVLGAERYGYQFDQMGRDAVLGAIKVMLADHTDLLQRMPVLVDSLLDSLDVFIRAGWPEAIQLAQDLDWTR